MSEEITNVKEDQEMQPDTRGGRIAARRKGKNLTQQQLADRLGVTNKAVSKWETNEGCPDIKLIPELCRALDMTTDELLTGVSARLTFWAWCQKNAAGVSWALLGAGLGAVLGILAYHHGWLG